MNNPFDGYISDVQAYKSMLDPAQVQKLYNEGLTGKPLPMQACSDGDPLMTMRMAHTAGITGIYMATSRSCLRPDGKAPEAANVAIRFVAASHSL